MFVVSDSAAAAIRTAMEEFGELGAAAELRRLYPGIRDFAHAQQCARIIAGWAAADNTNPRKGCPSSAGSSLPDWSQHGRNG